METILPSPPTSHPRVTINCCFGVLKYSFLLITDFLTIAMCILVLTLQHVIGKLFTTDRWVIICVQLLYSNYFLFPQVLATTIMICIHWVSNPGPSHEPTSVINQDTISICFCTGSQYLYITIQPVYWFSEGSAQYIVVEHR